ncbi:LacI family DNA-binding transcriptional regulator [Sphingobium algorifonticola]|uniref:LacI family DNA-binding transcriptional regulator n=1 Tax=Sphingobium algorifonticola TaxID=2008318 RepID=A0A437JCF0_9SPHN|nr:LacI family DNA-binding transcriptional regulator [Sphingobium algorifonticola]RVT43575.1 LacI family DNA-binding transcriptional regulator [Sphingobium algorifonticola]
MAKQAQDEGLNAKLTINDIARMAGVSKKTVSRVINRSPLLNAQTREKVEQIIADTGYVPNPQARALALGRNFLIGLIYDNPNQQMILSMQRGILEALHGTEFELVVRPVDRGSARVMDDIRGFITRQRLYGVILLPPISENDTLARLCDEEGCRYVRMGSAVLDDPEHMVVSNDRDAVADAVRYLIAQGHRRIGLIAGPHGFRSAKERRDGFELALSEAGISLPRSLVADGQYTFESGISACESLLDLSPRPTAIFAANDEMAAGVLYAARLRGIEVPDELSIIGFDDTPLTTRVWPPLTTVRWPIVAMGRAAALKLIGTAIGEGSAVNEPSTFSSTLIRRGSVAPLPIA